MTETWLPVVGWEGLYEVSDHGNVRSLDRLDRTGRPLVGKLLKPWLAKRPDGRDGHMSVELCRGRVGVSRKLVRVHVLMLEAFVSPRPAKLQGLHRDDNPRHNLLPNLYWGTAKQNREDSVRNGKHHYSRRSECSNGHEFTPENTRMDGNRRVCRKCRRKVSTEWSRRNRKSTLEPSF